MPDLSLGSFRVPFFATWSEAKGSGVEAEKEVGTKSGGLGSTTQETAWVSISSSAKGVKGRGTGFKSSFSDSAVQKTSILWDMKWKYGKYLRGNKKEGAFT